MPSVPLRRPRPGPKLTPRRGPEPVIGERPGGCERCDAVTVTRMVGGPKRDQPVESVLHMPWCPSWGR
jgi:hypothetical protein